MNNKRIEKIKCTKISSKKFPVQSKLCSDVAIACSPIVREDVYLFTAAKLNANIIFPCVKYTTCSSCLCTMLHS